MVRIYLSEGMSQYEELIGILHDDAKVRGVTAFRGIAGFGESGAMHSSSLLDLSLNLPIIIEFFDSPEKVEAVLKSLNTMIKPGHLVSWSAHINC
jgi:PII-like signaling protein